MASRTYPYPISNKYTFACIFSDPDNAKPLLEAVLGVPIGEVRVVEPEHTVQTSLRSRGVRMDVFVEDGTGAVYDVEMQNAEDDDLALRSRYLLSSFDRDRIMHGDPYSQLKRSIVIFVCNFDPLGFGERMYVIQPAVLSHWQVYDDGTMRVFLNAKGAANDKRGWSSLVTPRVASFLSYVDGGGTMGDEWLEHIDQSVQALNDDMGWRDTMLGLELDYQRARQQSMEEGRAAGLEEGRAAGLEEGRAAGLEEGRAAGLEEGRAAGLEEGRAAGLEEGAREERKRILLLTEALAKTGRLEELASALGDAHVMERLLIEFGLEMTEGQEGR